MFTLWKAADSKPSEHAMYVFRSMSLSELTSTAARDCRHRTLPKNAKLHSTLPKNAKLHSIKPYISGLTGLERYSF
jgi:hypothetical protein